MEVIKYNRIKAVLSEKSITSKALADHLGVTLATVSRWCTNTAQPDIQTLYKIAEYCGCSARDLIYDEPVTSLT